ncbi:MAG: membrane dipeptidase [Rhodospirillaceae bacterium]|jgi:membrane dipeptidase|nr:membrane dipeptidase [Rhodospirillaceae bacterium]MBT4687140.1 membrane dipeptidase [Rhodospirillaceae bacterium]MBT5081330.1 membrane dipeptidase [Rhodospirillaceae bacterium]MBT5522814.1 membrane dipeptidase [Rhodospirillaceae bacterium]MBT5880951.1 membrane dipeptidase [Rhodospirillaceae bacterium]
MDAEALHSDAIVIDATCPLAQDPSYLDWWRQGGATAIAPTISGMSGNARTGFAAIGGWHRYIRSRDDTLLVLTAGDIEQAKREGKLGLILHCQGTTLLEDELDLVDAYHAAGLRIVQLCYNRKNLVGDGAAERTDGGLSYFGVALIERLNALGMIVDCAHTGHRTSMEAVEVSQAPVIISHANARAVYDSRRNIEDDLIRAVATSGGVVGTVGFPSFLTAKGQPSLDQFIDDMAYKADLVGIDHVGIGIDYYLGQHGVESDADARVRYDRMIADGHWREAEYPAPPYMYPKGIETPQTLRNLTARLLERGFAEDDVRKILGLNWMRVYGEVWGG